MPILNKIISEATLQEILLMISGSRDDSVAASTIAKNIKSAQLTKDDVSRIVQGLEDRFAFFEVPKTPSGRYKGLKYLSRQVGSCSVVYARNVGNPDWFFKDFEPIGSCMDSSECRNEYRALEKILKDDAAQRGVPFLAIGSGINSAACLPFFLKAINE